MYIHYQGIDRAYILSNRRMLYELKNKVFRLSFLNDTVKGIKDHTDFCLVITHFKINKPIRVKRLRGCLFMVADIRISKSINLRNILKKE